MKICTKCKQQKPRGSWTDADMMELATALVDFQSAKRNVKNAA
jgi:NMD protein affecting ribosome stability and mRNA decay